MSEKKVDLSQIRGDWDFHSRYVAHAMDQTLKRANKLWREMKASSRKKGQVPVDGETTEAFIEAIYQAKGMTDDLFILAECKPTAKKKARKKAKRKAKKKARKKAKKKAKKRGKRK
ncbi:MAG: hypothetical protein QF790_10030 [Gammaproteobacteria bacterium]|jgi:hypothetical protein|nr:hypothetical protein [Gammaproteobacteria bacterium]MDP6617489.1 hypothetical protein [Gammaproteobacteria bacterium]MDP6695640.1 hypothetical protein [Gammaproteobacteria bacterium]